jgi:hypothetical protein
VGASYHVRKQGTIPTVRARRNEHPLRRHHQTDTQSMIPGTMQVDAGRTHTSALLLVCFGSVRCSTAAGCVECTQWQCVTFNNTLLAPSSVASEEGCLDQFTTFGGVTLPADAVSAAQATHRMHNINRHQLQTPAGRTSAELIETAARAAVCSLLIAGRQSVRSLRRRS